MLEKLTLRYEPDEDRLLLSLHVQAAHGLQKTALHITRRVAAALRDDLAAMQAMARSEPQSAYARQPPVKAPTRAAQTMAAPGERAAQEADHTPAPPPADAALLVHRIRCARRRTDGRWLIKFEHRQQVSASLLLSDQALADLATALQKHLDKANWALAPAVADKPGVKPTPPRALH